MALPLGLAIAGFVLSAASTAYGIYKSETQEEPEQPLGIPPGFDTGGLGTPEFDMSELSRFRQQVPEYGAGGSNLGQAMAAFQPMRLGDVLRPQMGLGEDRFSLGRRKRRF